MKLSGNKVGCWAGILLLIALASGCSCKKRAARLVPVQDKLQSYVIIGRNDPPKCALPWRDKALLADRQVIVKFWVRSVFRDALLTPEPLKVLHYDVVNEFGESFGALIGYSGSVTTDSQGYARLPEFRPGQIGSFRIRVEFADRKAQATVYSMPIIVR